MFAEDVFATSWNQTFLIILNYDKLTKPKDIDPILLPCFPVAKIGCLQYRYSALSL